MLVGSPDAPSATRAPVTTPTPSSSASSTATVSDGRTVELVSLGGPATQPLLTGCPAPMDDAVRAVTAFWGADWPRDIVVVATASDEQFRALAGGGSDIAAATTGRRIVFAPGAAAMSDDALRIVLRHELFHYAARADTAVDAPRWLTEGVADFVARPAAPRPGPEQAAEIGDAAHPTPISTPRDRPARSPTTAPGGSPASSPTGTGPRRCGACTNGPAGRATPTSRRPSPRPSAPTSTRCSAALAALARG